jgi:hypothetical protein
VEGDQRLQGPQLGAERAQVDHVPDPLDQGVLPLGTDGEPEGAGQAAALLPADEQAGGQRLARLHVRGPVGPLTRREGGEGLVDPQVGREGMPLHGEESIGTGVW